MTIEAVIQQAQSDGVRFRLTGGSTVKVLGEPAAVEKWLPILRERKPDLQRALTSGRAAVDLLNRSGARLLPHRHRTIAIPRGSDTLALRRAIFTLGYGSYAVIHLETRGLRGQGATVVEAALMAAGGLPS